MALLPPTLEPSVNSLQKLYRLLVSIINGKVAFGDGVKTNNIDGSWVSVVTPGVANTDFTVNHVLNRVPVGYLVMSKSGAVDVYTGSIAATKTQLTLRATTTGVNVVLFIF